MVFSSTLFLYCFLPVTLAGYYAGLLLDKSVFHGRKVCSNYWLLIMSLLFFAWSQLNYVWIIVVSILVNYLGAVLIDLSKEKYLAATKAMGTAESKDFSKVSLFFTVLVNLLLLFYFKYFDFTIDTINHLLSKDIPLRNIVLPIGISFFTFQAMSYTCDVYMGKARVQRNPFKLALYVMLFPQLIAGPIVRYTDVQAEIDERRVTVDDFSEGARRFIVGLGKKALIANTMAVTVDSIWSQGIENNTVAVAWLGAIAYSLQIYFDFSGYSDMAIGLGRMFGFHFLENFNLPYISRSITEFWRRWHMSLSSWFRDYVYIPLGGNRHGTINTYRNLFIIFLLTGIWHGAAWHYIFWGIWHGFFMLVERGVLKSKSREEAHRGRLQETFIKGIQHIYALLVVMTGWIFFRADSMGEAIWYLKTMLGKALGSEPGFSVMWYLDRWTVFMLVVGCGLSVGLPQAVFGLVKDREGNVKAAGDGNYEDMYRKGFTAVLRDGGLLLILLLSGMSIVSGTYNPFIYFQF